MKKLQILFLVIVCSLNNLMGQTKNYAKFEAEIANSTGQPLIISNGEKVIKKIEINGDGIYKDTLNVKEGTYKLYDGKQYIPLFLSNESDLKLKMDANNIDETITFSGNGSDMNNYFIQLNLAQKKYDYEGLFSLNETDFKKKVEEMKVDLLAVLNKYNFTTEKKAMFEKSLGMFYSKLREYYASVQVQKAQNQIKSKLDGTQAPSFNYVNYAGGKTKLEDFKGKFVYVDVWATWCGPCRGEIPFLQKLEKEYEGKKIVFLSMSIDTQKDFEKWKTFVKEKNLGGVQVIADKDWQSDFVTKFGINGIPRFILIGPDGKVVHSNAARPSDPELKKVLDNVLKQ